LVISTQKNTFRHISGNLKSSIIQNCGGQQVIERILAAYDFTSRKALCNHLGIPQSTMANRYARDTFPADWVVICGIETGVSIEWLSSGVDINAPVYLPADSTPTQGISPSNRCSNNTKYPIENITNLNQGGKAAIERLVEAYGFTTRQALADHLGVSKSTLANRYMRNTFPADWIIQCALETGVPLDWLVSGIGESVHKSTNEVFKLQKFCLTQGNLKEDGECVWDKNYISIKEDSLYIVVDEKRSYICDSNFNHVEDGKWLIDIDGQKTLRDIVLLSNSKIQVRYQDSTFVYNKNDITFISFVRVIITEVKK